jgi:2-polyprenyl-3-methyl-5-hydroxy-6-metoxy-1,4-benzoquinol methylase
MLIEHVDDRSLLRELRRILRDDGILVLSTVIRRQGAWYLYHDGAGHSLLAPDHVREYESQESLVSLFRESGFHIEFLNLLRIRFSPIDGILRAAYRTSGWGILKSVAACGAVTKLRGMTRLALPKYFALEIIARNR